MNESAGRVAAPTGKAWTRHLPVFTLAALSLTYLANVLGWVSQSDVWLHTDGHIHFTRIQEFARGLFGDTDLSATRLLFGYGPMVYLATALAFGLLGPTYSTAVLVQCLFGMAGGVGAFLCGRRLAGPWAGVVAAAALLFLPVYLVRTWDVMADLPQASLSLLTLGVLVSSRGVSRISLSLLAGLVLGLALMSKWTAIFGLGPVLLLVLGGALVKENGWSRGVLLSLGGVALVGLALWAWYALVPEEADAAPCVVAGVLFGLGAVAAAVLAWKLERWRRTFNAVALICTAGAITAPLLMFGRGGFLWQVSLLSEVQLQLLRQSVDRPDLAGILSSLVWIWHRWELGPLLALLLLPGVALGLWRRETRPVAATLLVFFAAHTVMVILAMDLPAERHLLAGMVCLSPLATAWLVGPPLPARLRKIAPALLVIWSLVHGLGWLIPGMPGARSPEPWHRDIQLYSRKESPWTPAWAGTSSPLQTLLPYRKQGQTEAARSLVAKLGQGETCGVFIVDPAARETFDHMQEINGFMREAQRFGSLLGAVDALDQPEAPLAAYDFWLVVEPPTPRPGEDLATRLVTILGGDQMVEVGWQGTFLKSRLSAIWYHRPPRRAECQMRLSRYQLLPLGTGYRRANNGAGPALPRELLQR